jgi:hypothetical protein
MLLFAAGMVVQVVSARGYEHQKLQGTGGARIAGRPVSIDSYTIAPLTIPGAVFSIATDINERGMVVGVYDVITGTGVVKEYTFLSNGNQLHSIEHAGSDYTSVAGINNSATVLFGNWGSDTQQTAGFYDLKTGVFTGLQPVPGKPINIGVRLTDSGVALGYACEGTFFQPVNCVSWLSKGGSYEFFQPASQPIVAPSYINNRGQVVGYAGDGVFWTGFLYEDGVTTWLYPPGITSTEFMPRAISNSGVILMNGETDPASFWEPFLYDHGTVKPLPEYDAPGQTTWLAMNGRGDLAGLFCSETGCFALVGRRK